MAERRVFDKNRIQRGKGFTLVELIVVIMITLILAGGVVFGISSWITKMNFKRQNEYAQTLFFAAQDQLANYSENGLLTELTENVPQSAYLSSGQITSMKSCTGKTYTMDDVWAHSKGSNIYQGQIASIVGTPDDFSKYQAYLNADDTARKNMEKDKAVILYSILSPYVYDQSIFTKGVVCLEFTPADGQVFAAFYSDVKKDLAYIDEHTDTTGAMNNRADDFRIKGMLGYFGVDTLSKATNLNKDKPAIKNLSLNNEETLNLSFGISNVNASATITQLNYYIDVCDSKKGEATPVMRIEMTGAQLMQPNEVNNPSRIPTLVKVILYKEDGTSKEFSDVPIQTWVDEKNEIHIVLDGADLDADCKKVEALQYGTAVNESELFQTFSFHRFGLDAQVENICCLVEADGAMYRKTAQKKSGIENVYFGTVTQSTKLDETETADKANDIQDVVYTIENGRHLYNIRYMEEVEKLRQVKYPNLQRITYRLVQDVDWKAMLDQKALYASPSPSTNTESTNVSRVYKTTSTDADSYLVFPSIQKLQKNSILESRSEDENSSYKISGLKITEEQNQAYLVYASSETTSINTEAVEAKVADAKSTKNAPAEETASERQTGLFCVNEGWISDVNLGGCWVSGTENVGILCGVNRGVIQNVKILKNSEDRTDPVKSSVVSGIENVGGIVGRQEGSKCTERVPQTREKSTNTYELANAARLKNNYNYADIYGVKNTGGISGYLITESTKETSIEDVRVESCVNYGKVREAVIQSNETKQNENEILFSAISKDYCEKNNINGAADFIEQYSNFGGIIGKIEKEGAQVSILLCTSSSVYTDKERDEFISALKSQKLYSNCVGGIIGYNDGAVVKACNTEKENSSEESYVFGNRHVGGIIGWNCSEHTQIMILDGASDKSSYSINQANVIGNEYVGGVVGMNAGAAEETTTSSSESEEKDLHSLEPLVGSNRALLIKNWMNQGVVIARKQYAGGIAGCNTGIIANCQSDVANSMKLTTLTKKIYNTETDLIGNYVGGMTGYNNGIITNQSVTDDLTYSDKTDQIGLVVYLTGRNYVGGITGYNDEDAQIRGIKLDGGTIDGKGCCVGGIAGFNASVQLLSSTTDKVQKLNSNPNVVNGTYMVGGTIGANVIDAGRIQKDSAIKAEFRTDNFLGMLTAKAFAGGFIGYNHVLKVNASQESSRLAIKQEIDGLTEKLEKQVGNTEPSLRDTVFLIENAFPKTNFQSVQRTDKSGRMQIDAAAKDGLGDTTSATLRGITANIYVGGVLGYNADDTQLLISYQKNTTPVRAKMAIPNEKEQPDKKTFDGKEFKYSYAGGIIGKVTEFCIIYQCGNTDRGTVIASGTYTGGLCEINEGTIQECEVSSVGDKVDYVGGLVGVNKQKGFIYQCKLDGQTITGKNIVGGLAAENYGVIDGGSIQDLTITAGEKNVGGIVGWNHKDRDINKQYYYIDNKDVKDKTYSQAGPVVLLSQSKLSVSSIQADGENVGAVIGQNQGILDISTDTTKVSLEGTTKASVIIGKGNVGGFVGCEEGQGVKNLQNEIRVQALDGNAGGITGIMKEKGAEISNCVNKGEVSAENSGNAGGITSENMGSISACTDYAAVSAKNGYSGGIAAVNGSDENADAKISQCTVTTDRQNLVFSGKQCAGGLIARNYATAENCMVSGDGTNTITVSNLAESAKASVKVLNTTQEGSMIGGIAGINEDSGTIINCSVGANKKNNSNPDNWNIVTTESKAAKAFAGGIAGLNRGTIKGADDTYSKVFAKVCFTTQNRAYFGYLGGITGQNRGMVTNYEFNGIVEGTTNNPSDKPVYNPNTDYESGFTKLYGYGGIAGVNGIADKAKTGETKTKGQIQNCKVNIADISSYGEDTNIANIGGVTGVNGLGSEISEINFGEAYVFNSTAGNYSDNNRENIIPADKYSVYVHDAGNYAHLGGVAGLNSGAVSKIGYTNEDTFDKIIDTQRVAVESYRGHVGGIIGWNRRVGTVQRTATGKLWIVHALENAQDNGCGGIIGYQSGENGLQYCTNRAKVEKYISNTSNPANAVGGIIGRSEVTASRNYTISYCHNYGQIRANARAGGIIGCLKYNVGNIYECTNYGTIDAMQGSGCGGIIGTLYESNGTLSITKCQNHGSIGIYSKQNAAGYGGILGTVDGGSVVLQIEDCVNTGLIANTQMSGGIIGGNTIHVNSTIKKCRNYGYAYYNKYNLGGIIPNSMTQNITIEDCFGLADTKNPICKNTSIKNQNKNYYLKPGEEDTDDTEPVTLSYVQQVEVTTTKLDQKANLYKIVMPDTYQYKGTNCYYQSGWTGQLNYTFTFNQPVNLTKIELFWHRNGNDKRLTDYNIQYFVNGDWANAAQVQNIIPIDSQNLDGKICLANYSEIAKGTPSEAAARECYENQATPITTTKIRIQVLNCRKRNISSGSNLACALARIRFNGYTDNDRPNCATKITSIGYTNAKDEGVSYTDDNNKALFTWDKEPDKNGILTYTLNNGTGSVEKVETGGTEAMVTPDGSNSFTLKLSEGTILGIPGFPVNIYLKMKTDTADHDTSLTELGDNTDNIRYTTFKQVDAYMTSDIYYSESSDDTQTQRNVKKPNNITFSEKTNNNGTYQANWGLDDSSTGESPIVYNYEVIYRDADNNPIGSAYRNLVYGEGNRKASFPMLNLTNSEPDMKNSIFRVRAGIRVVKADGGIEMLWSEWEQKTLESLQRILPSPRFHLELKYVDNSLKYQCILDNREEYVEFIRSQNTAELNEEELNQKLSNIRITVNPGDFNFTVKDGKSSDDLSKFYVGKNDSNNQNFTGFALSISNTYARSQNYVRQSMVWSQERLLSAEEKDSMAIIQLSSKDGDPSLGFHGVTTEQLDYQVLTKYKSIIGYVNTVLMATDMELKVPVALSAAQVRISDVTNVAARLHLNGLPEELLNQECYKNLYVRSYPVMFSNNVVYLGHDVKLADGTAQFTKDELKKMYVDKDGLAVLLDPKQEVAPSEMESMQKLIDEKGLQKGYILQLNEDGTIGISYNALLEYFEDHKDASYDEDSKNGTRWQYQIYTYDINDGEIQNNTLPAPYITVNDHNKNDDGELQIGKSGENGNVNEESMCIYWDLKHDGDLHYRSERYGTGYDLQAKYQYTIYGIVKESTEEDSSAEKKTQLLTGTYETPTEGDDFIQGLNVLRQNIDSWPYDSIEIRMTRMGVEKDEENEDNRVTQKYPSTTVLRISGLKTRLSQITKPFIDLASDDNGFLSEKDALIYDISWKPVPEEEQADGIGSYLVKARIKGDNTYTELTELKVQRDDDGELKKDDAGNLTYIYVIDGKTYSTIETKVRLNLKAYEGQEIEVAIQAIAQPDSTKYRNAQDGVLSEMKLPSRLTVPQITNNQNPSSDYNYSMESSLSAEEFETGLQITMNNESVAQDLRDSQSRYEIAIAVYEQAPDDKQDNIKLNIYNVEENGTIDVDAPDSDSEGYWNSGALATLIKKSDGVKMDGSLQSDNCTLKLRNLSTEYAGKWLKIAMRTVSDIAISSNWTDEDEANLSVNYAWIQIPRLKEVTPTLTKGTVKVYYEGNNESGYSYSSLNGSGAELQALQESLSFGCQKYADTYEVRLVRSYEQQDWVRVETENSEYCSRYYAVDFLNFVKNEDGSFDVYYASSSPDAGKLQENKQEKKIGILTKDTPLELLGLSGEAQYIYNNKTYPFALSGVVRMKSDDSENQTIEIILPNAEKIVAGSYESSYEYYYIGQTSVRAVISKDTDAEKRYASSDIRNWSIEGNKTEILKEYTQWDKETNNAGIQVRAVVATDVTDKTDRVTYISEIRLDKTVPGHVVYRIYNKRTKSYEYVSSCGGGLNKIENVAFLKRDNYQSGDTLQIEAACVSVPKGGVGEWMNFGEVTLNSAQCGIKPEALSPINVEKIEPDSETDGSIFNIFWKNNYSEEQKAGIRAYQIYSLDEEENQISIVETTPDNVDIDKNGNSFISCDLQNYMDRDIKLFVKAISNEDVTCNYFDSESGTGVSVHVSSNVTESGTDDASLDTTGDDLSVIQETDMIENSDEEVVVMEEDDDSLLETGSETETDAQVDASMDSMEAAESELMVGE